MTTGPTIRTTFGVCVPGASCPAATPDCFVPFVWAKRFENAPEPSSATKTPMRQKTEAIKTRKLKKADCEVDFVFINEVESFPSAVNPKMVRKTLGEMQELCQVLFESIQTRIARINAKKERKFSSPITRFCQRGAARHEWRKQRSLALIGLHRSDFLPHWTFGRIEKR